MIKIIITIIILLSICNLAYSMPTEDEKNQALILMYQDSSDQELHFYNTSNYESTKPRWNGGLVHYACSYSTFNGKGYILSVIKTEDGKVWRIQRHFGPENMTVNETWTCQNCNGESFNFPKVNEHGLCQ